MKTAAIGLLFGLTLALVAGSWASESARADNGPHVQNAGATTDGCAGCHRAHTGKATGLTVDVQPAICYTCHGATASGATTAVENGTQYTTITHGAAAGALKGGGFATARIMTSDSTLPATGTTNTGLTNAAVTIGVLTTGTNTSSRHTIDGTSGTMWGAGTTGYGSANSLRCGSCHDPHGNGKFRILRPIPVGSGAATAVNVAEDTNHAYTTTNYLVANQGLSAGAAANMNSWCSTCHTRYASGATTGDTNFNYRHQAQDGSVPGCTTCHVAHGTNAVVTSTGPAASVKWPDGTNWSADTSTPALAAGASANSRLLRMDNRGMCQKCHNK